MTEISRRQFLKRAFQGAVCALAAAPLLRPLAAMGLSGAVRPALLRYGGNWNARPNALRTLLAEVASRTSAAAAAGPATVRATDEDLFRYPLLWMTGNRRMDPLPQTAVESLRRHLSFGGTLVVDDASGQADSSFARSVGEQLARIFPQRKLEPLPAGHAAYMSYYAVRRAAGLQRVSEQLSGISIDDRAVVIFSPNDLSGALERTATGQWQFTVQETEDRTLALRLGVNLVMYALTVNYKLDQVHVSYRLKHPEAYPRFRLPAADAEGTGAR